MFTHYHVVSNGCLLTLCPVGDDSGQPLPKALARVLRSRFPSVWVDCRHLAALPTGAMRLLRQYAAQLWQGGSCLLLCHLPPGTRTSSEEGPTAGQPLAASLLDATLYGLDCPPRPTA